ncbi:cytochrome b/b6 domain-containing protein [Methylomonas sp. LL1]|uniref:cytochrome b/b6 domain-containing protein n=1 Tax=Methylomonas sp. LL1 TaxID=2785785 RepID=UPI0018C3C3E7|nr:cytochrome b/b6 domain-containing protein [Methylomonas sp. LL1]QPK64639.1 cytochrome b/b6 domain-containing protein [Methylomonas sp. LL1]
MTNEKQTLRVWEPVIRIGHWILALAFFTAYFTEDDFMTLHVWAGYVVGAYLLTRIVWGFVGGKYARFSSFIYSPSRIMGYLKNLIAAKPQHYIGHNPAGGVMVIALLLSLSATTFTGLKLYAVEDNKGPFALSATQVQTQIQSVSLISVANAEDNEEEDDEKSELIDSEYKIDKQAEEFWEELHEFFTNLTLLLVFLHIIGVAVSSYIDKEKLVKAMFTGNKDIDDTYQ